APVGQGVDRRFGLGDGPGEHLRPAALPGPDGLGVLGMALGERTTVLVEGDAAVGRRMPGHGADLTLEAVTLGGIGEDLRIEGARVPAHDDVADVPDDDGRPAHRSTEGSALLGFEARVGLVDDVDPALAAHELAVAVTRLERLERASDLHDPILRLGP